LFFASDIFSLADGKSNAWGSANSIQVKKEAKFFSIIKETISNGVGDCLSLQFS
jgi:hypothetical protein